MSTHTPSSLPPAPDAQAGSVTTGLKDQRRTARFLLIGLVIGTIVGVLFGGYAPAAAQEVDFIGKMFINLLKVMVVPLVITSMIVGITGIGDIRHLGSYGGKVLVYFLLTTFLAVLLGLLLVNWIEPGRGYSYFDAGVFEAAGLKHADDGGSHWTATDPALAPIAADLNAGTITEDRAILSLTAGWPVDDARFDALNKRLDSYAKVNAQPKSGREGLAERLWTEKTSNETFAFTAGKAAPADSADARAKLAARTLTPQEATRLLLQKRRENDANANPFNAIKSVIMSMVPTNIVKAATTEGGDILGLIVFGIFFGIVAVMLGPKAKPVLDFVISLNEIIMAMVHVVILMAPVGICCLVAGTIGSKGGFAGFVPLLIKLGWYALTVVIGLIIHGAIILPLILWVFARRNPLQFTLQFSRALVLAFTTSSSSATLPVSIECAQVNAGISRRAREFILPLGATINMNGTALYEAVAVLFIAQIYGMELSFGQQVILFLTATLAAIGAAGIPEAGLVTMVMVMSAIGVPVEGMSFILVIDWILDRCRTVINVWGDMVGCAIMDKHDPPKAEGA